MPLDAPDSQHRSDSHDSAATETEQRIDGISTCARRTNSLPTEEIRSWGPASIVATPLSGSEPDKAQNQTYKVEPDTANESEASVLAEEPLPGEADAPNPIADQDGSSQATALRVDAGRRMPAPPVSPDVEARLPDTPAPKPAPTIDSISFVDPQNFLPWIKLDKQPVVTKLLVAVNTVIFALMTLTTLIDPYTHKLDLIKPFANPYTQTLIAWGADYGPLTLSGEMWRVWTANYLHIGGGHLVVNMVMLWALGSVAERLFGHTKYLLLYTLSGIAGSALSLLVAPAVPSAGASGAIMGICGALVGFTLMHKADIEPIKWRGLLRGVLTYFGLCIVIGLFTHSNNAAHAGGFIAGIACGAAFAGRLGILKFIAIAGAVALLLLLDTTAPFDTQGKILLNRATHLRDSKQYAKALALCELGESKYPKDYYFATEAANISLAQKDFDSAKRHASLAVMISPNSDTLLTRANTNLVMQRPEAALEDLGRLLEKHPDNLRARGLRAYAYEAMNEPFLSLEDLRLLREAEPDSTMWMKMEAFATADAGNVDKAITLFDDLASRVTATDGLKGSFARTLSQAQRFDDALSMANSIVAPKAKFNTKVYIYLDHNDIAHAKQAAEAALEHSPRDPEAHIAMAAVLWASAHRSEAATEADKAFKFSESTPAQRRLYHLLLKAVAGNPQQEKEALQSIAKLTEDMSKTPWQGYLGRYFLGQTSANYLLQLASNKNEQTEAHTYIGLWSMKHGYSDPTRARFAWVMSKGNKGFLEYGLVRSLVAHK